MCIQRPMSDDEFWAEYERCEHGVKVPEGKSDVDVCEDCREYYGSLQQEGSVGK